MTKHNLKDHLNWLVKSRPRFPRHSTATLEARSEATAFLEIVPAVQPPADPVNKSAPSTGSSVNCDGRSGLDDTVFIRPSIPASVLKGNAGNALNMGRLQSGTRSSNKPQLISERLSTTIQSPFPPRRTPGVSLTEKYTAHCSRPSDGNFVQSRLNWSY